MSKLFVTGATGFVGRALVANLLAAGHSIVAALRSKSLLPPELRGVERVAFDLQDPASLDPDAFADVDCVVHCAARVHVMTQSAADADRFRQSNTVATESLARAAAKAGVRRFIFLSSVKVNGERTEGAPFTESDRPRPVDFYAQSKLEAELALWRIADAMGLEVVAVRCPLVYGPHASANFLRLVSLVERNWPLPLSLVNNRRSLVGIGNLCSLLEALIDAPALKSRVVMVSDGQDLSLPELIRLIASAMQKPARLFPMPVAILKAAALLTGMKPEVSRLCDSLTVDISGTRSALDWSPPMTVAAGIQATVEWYVRQIERGTRA
jgi:UDP-glucose 4-epimerase